MKTPKFFTIVLLFALSLAIAISLSVGHHGSQGMPLSLSCKRLTPFLCEVTPFSSDPVILWDGTQVSFLVPPQESQNTIPFGPEEPQNTIPFGPEEPQNTIPFGPSELDVCPAGEDEFSPPLPRDSPGEDEVSPPLSHDPPGEDEFSPPLTCDPLGEDEYSPPSHSLMFGFYRTYSSTSFFRHFYLVHTSPLPQLQYVCPVLTSCLCRSSALFQKPVLPRHQPHGPLLGESRTPLRYCSFLPYQFHFPPFSSLFRNFRKFSEFS
jgi:hypothetical protein